MHMLNVEMVRIVWICMQARLAPWGSVPLLLQHGRAASITGVHLSLLLLLHLYCGRLTCPAGRLAEKTSPALPSLQQRNMASVLSQIIARPRAGVRIVPALGNTSRSACQSVHRLSPSSTHASYFLLPTRRRLAIGIHLDSLLVRYQSTQCLSLLTYIVYMCNRRLSVGHGTLLFSCCLLGLYSLHLYHTL